MNETRMESPSLENGYDVTVTNNSVNNNDNRSDYFPNLLGLHRVGVGGTLLQSPQRVGCSPVASPLRDNQILLPSPKLMRRKDETILNNRGLPARIRKKNPLFYGNDVYNEDDRHVFRRGSRITSSPTIKSSLQVANSRSSQIKQARIPIQKSKIPIQNGIPLRRSRRKVEAVKQPSITTAKQKMEAAQEVARKLKQLLQLPKAHNWACCEFFYSDLDKLLRNMGDDFTAGMMEFFPPLKKYSLTRTQWCMIRKMLGKPRRFSSKYLSNERLLMKQKRTVIRFLQKGKFNMLEAISDIPEIIVSQPVVGSFVTARLEDKHSGLYIGKIAYFDSSNNICDVAFDNPTLGTRPVPDYNVSSHEPIPSVSKTTLLRAICNMNKKNKDPPLYVRKIMSELNHRRYNNMTNIMQRLGETDYNRVGEHSTRLSVPHSIPMAANIVDSSPDMPEPQEEIKMFSKAQYPISELVAKLRRLLDYKSAQVQVLHEMNVDAERMCLYNEDISEDFKVKYASIIVGLESLNSVLKGLMGSLNDMLTHVVPESIISNLSSTTLQEKTRINAKEIVEKNMKLIANNMVLSKFPLKNFNPDVNNKEKDIAEENMLDNKLNLEAVVENDVNEIEDREEKDNDILMNEKVGEKKENKGEEPKTDEIVNASEVEEDDKMEAIVADVVMEIDSENGKNRETKETCDKETEVSVKFIDSVLANEGNVDEIMEVENEMVAFEEIVDAGMESDGVVKKVEEMEENDIVHTSEKSSETIDTENVLEHNQTENKKEKCEETNGEISNITKENDVLQVGQCDTEKEIDKSISSVEENESLILLVQNLVAMILQIKNLAEKRSSYYEIEILNKSMGAIKTSLNPKVQKSFEDHVEVHMRQIQAYLEDSKLQELFSETQ